MWTRSDCERCARSFQPAMVGSRDAKSQEQKSSEQGIREKLGELLPLSMVYS